MEKYPSLKWGQDLMEIPHVFPETGNSFLKLAQWHQDKEKDHGNDIVVLKFVSDTPLIEQVPLTLWTEFHILQKLDHPHIVSALGLIQGLEEHPGLMMQYYGNTDFFSYLMEADLRLAKTKREILRLFRQVMAALAYCHHMGVAHRDLKPENVMVVSSKKHASVDGGGDCENQSDDSQAVLIDFGVSWSQDLVDKPIYPICAGTAEFVAPEIACLDRKGHHWTRLVTRLPFNVFAADIWSAGVFLWSCVTQSGLWDVQATTTHSSQRAAPDDSILCLTHTGRVLQEVRRFKMLDKKRLDRKYLRYWTPVDWRPLLSDILQVDPTKRPSADKIVQKLDELLASTSVWDKNTPPSRI